MKDWRLDRVMLVYNDFQEYMTAVGHANPKHRTDEENSVLHYLLNEIDKWNKLEEASS